jgi:hypothetical protein
MPTSNDKLLDGLDGYFRRHCVAWASYKTYFRTFLDYNTLEYNGIPRAEVDWQGSADWSALGFPGRTLVEVYDTRFNGFTVTSVGFAKPDADQFLRLLDTPDNNKPSTKEDIDEQLRAITGQ